ncbi:MAG TPA: AAA family ATPase [Acidimicrobiales bacterium]|nr:AAA family ATPase [Acidimicrobiales bacterium]
MNAPTFVGRRAELARLEEAVRAARRGQRAVVILGGEAGIGKTTLVTEVARRARDGGAEVLVGGCLDLDLGGVPYAPLVEALRDLAARRQREGIGWGEAPGEDDDGDGTSALLDPSAWSAAGALPAVHQVIDHLGRAGPVVLVLEDVHWADRSTRDLIAYLASASASPPLALVVTYRSDDIRSGHPLRRFLAELERRPDVTHLRLERIGRADAAALVTAIRGNPPAAAELDALYQRSEGNPFFLEELARAAVPGAELPPLLRDVMAARVEQLSSGTQVVLRAAAVGGRRIEHDRLAAVLPLDDTDLTAALREARDANLITADAESGRYEFRHALLHEAVYADTLPGERSRYHAAYAELVSGRPGPRELEDWAQLAHHWRAAGRTDAALVAAVEAGLAAEAGYALPEADRYYDAALELWDALAGPPPPMPLTRSELLAHAGDAATRTGAFDRAVELVTAALAEVDAAADPETAGLLHERRAWFLLRAGTVLETGRRAAEVLAEYEHAVQLVPAEPTVARARVLAAYADALLRNGRPDHARSQAETAIAVATAVGAPFDEGHARHMLGLALVALGDTEGGIEELHRARVLAERNGDVADVAGTYVHLWRVLCENGRAEEMIRLATEAAGFCHAAGMDVAAQLLDAMAAGFLHQLGRWAEAARLLRTSDAAAWGLPAVVTHLMHGLLDVELGRLVSAREHLETARGLGAQISDGRINGLLFRGLAELAVWEGRTDDAIAAVCTGVDQTGDDEMLARLASLGLRAAADAAEAQRALGQPVGEQLLEVAAQHESLLVRLEERAGARRAPPASEVCAAAAGGRAEWARLNGRNDPDLWRDVVGRWETLGFPAPAAYARWRMASALVGAGRRAEAAQHWRAARQAAEELGAGSLRDALEADAARLLVPLVTGDAGGEADTGERRPYNLTPRELEVLTLVAAGRTNRQIGEALFISEKTASVHVSRILVKLGVSGRAQAAALAGQLGLAGTPVGTAQGVERSGR